MAHWLDGLFDGGITIEWGATDEALPERSTLLFSSAFSVFDDPVAKKTRIGIRYVEGMDGDVVGDTDENRVVTVSGDEETELVTFQCGICLTPRTVTGLATLAPADSLVFAAIAIEGEGLTLPDPADCPGRVFVVPVVGNPIPLRRHGAELINGESSDYTMPAGSIMVIATDGQNWVARPIVEPPIT
jgi:hypothetical protein